MGYSEAIRHSDFDGNAVYRTENTAKKEHSKAPIDFNKVFHEKYSDEIGENNITSEEVTSVSAGAAAGMLGIMAQMKDPYGLDSIDLFENHDDLDDSIGFDEIEELDGIADSAAAEIKDTSDNSIFFDVSIYEDEEYLASFDDIEEIM